MDISDIYIKGFSKLGSLATEWELRLRFLCSLLDIEAYAIVPKTSEKDEHLYARGMNKVLKALREKYPYLEYDFELAMNLRDAINHSNFDQFSKIINSHAGQNLRSQVISYSISDNKIVDLMDELSEGETHNKVGFGYLLSVVNQQSIDKASSKLLEAISDINFLVLLNSFSSEKQYFQKILQKGEKLTSKHIQEFKNNKTLIALLNEDPEKFFLRAYTFMKSN